jgi:nicotinate-nucleotide adenylyltransferase
VSVVAIYGGSFNPPHLAHVLATTVVLATEDVDQLLVVPTFRHPFQKPLADYDDRITMCELAMGWLPRVSVSRVEQELGGDSLTLRTLEHLHASHPDWKLRLVLGADLLADAPKWHKFETVMALAPPIVLGRAGFDAPGAPPPILPAISSTVVRSLIGNRDWDALASLVPKKVLEHVRQRGLYAGS